MSKRVEYPPVMVKLRDQARADGYETRMSTTRSEYSHRKRFFILCVEHPNVPVRFRLEASTDGEAEAEFWTRRVDAEWCQGRNDQYAPFRKGTGARRWLHWWDAPDTFTASVDTFELPDLVEVETAFNEWREVQAADTRENHRIVTIRNVCEQHYEEILRVIKRAAKANDKDAIDILEVLETEGVE